MAYRQTTLYSDTFGNLTCCSFTGDYYIASEILTAYSEGVNETNTVINMQAVAYTLQLRQIIPPEYIQELSGHFSDYTDPDIQSKIEFCV